MKTKLPETEAEYRAFLAARDADPETAARDAALLAYAETMPMPKRKRTPRPPEVPPDAREAIRKAARTAGWNNRRGDVRAFDLPSRCEQPCKLYVVPARVWAYRTWERQAAEWQRQHGGNAA